SVRILLSEDSDLSGLQAPDLHQVVDRGFGLLGIAGAVVEDIAVGGIVPEQAGAGECAEKQHVALKRVGQCDHRRGCPHVADYSKNFVVLIKLFHSYGSPSWLVTVVGRDEL